MGNTSSSSAAHQAGGAATKGQPWHHIRGRRRDRLFAPENINRAWTPSPGPSDRDDGLSLKRESELPTHESIIDNEEVEHIEDYVASGISSARSGSEVNMDELPASPLEDMQNTVPTLIRYEGSAERVFVTGTFTGWQRMYPLDKDPDDTWTAVLDLPKGTHKLMFVVDDEMKCSSQLPMATDSIGNFVNYLDVTEEKESGDSKYEQYDFDEEFTEPEKEYCSEIPYIITAPSEEIAHYDIEPPPVLPPQLDSSILNELSFTKEDTSVLPPPNHVVINHLATSSIKHNILSVSTTVRYSKKFVTQMFYSPM